MDFTRTKTCFQLECFLFFICEKVGKIISVPIRNCVNVQNSSSGLWKNKGSKREGMKEIFKSFITLVPLKYEKRGKEMKEYNSKNYSSNVTYQKGGI